MWGRTIEDTGQKQSATSAYQRAALIDPNNQASQAKLHEPQ
jgi:hypothetical protein